MDWGTVFGLIDTRLLVIVAVCWCLGYILKSTPRIPDWTIIYIVTVFAVAFTAGVLGFTVEAVIQGVLCGAFAVYGHQVLKQTKERE